VPGEVVKQCGQVLAHVSHSCFES
jgi:hypothetical protein